MLYLRMMQLSHPVWSFLDWFLFNKETNAVDQLVHFNHLVYLIFFSFESGPEDCW